MEDDGDAVAAEPEAEDRNEIMKMMFIRKEERGCGVSSSTT
jgi:hypothetical protein